jgi:hypothetical protein
MKISPKAIRITPTFQPAAFWPVSARGTPVVVSAGGAALVPPPTPPVAVGEALGLGDCEGVGEGAPPDGEAEGLGDWEGEELGDWEGEELGE